MVGGVDLSGKVAVVAGGTGALGSVVAATMVDAGASVSIIARNVPSGKKRQAVDRPVFDFYAADLANEYDTNMVLRRIHAEHGKIDIIVNASGGYWGGKKIKETTLEEWDALMRKNLTTAFLVTKEALSLMAGYGRIIHISAMTALEQESGKAAYAISKSGVALLALLASKEEKNSGVTINAIAPGIIKTTANLEWGSPSDTPHWVTPEQIAAQILYICSPEGGAINGGVIRMPGGVV